MNTGYKVATAVALVALAAALLIGCEDSAVIAPSDGRIIVTASPQTVGLDPDGGIDSATSTIVARVYDGSGYPLQNVGVTFSSTAGQLQSANNCFNGSTCTITGSACQLDSDCEQNIAPLIVRTDVGGNAVDVLNVRESDPATITVTAFSSTLSETVEVDKTIAGQNEPPLAAVFAVPPGSSVDCSGGGVQCQAQVGDQVRFDGTDSSDDVGITCYKWVVNSNVTGEDKWYQGPLASAITPSFDVEQTLDVFLLVSDNSDSSFCTPCQPPSAGGAATDCTADDSFFGDSASLRYEIVCANDPPVVQVSDDQSVVLSGGTVDVFLSGSASDSETDSGDLVYTWDCRNGTGTHSGPTVTCTYTSAGTKTATLRVTDTGNPPGECVRSTTADVTITVSNSTP